MEFVVSISQSRCFSFQAVIMSAHCITASIRFNLAIEMLFISGLEFLQMGCHVGLFQSRNRDAFHFRKRRSRSRRRIKSSPVSISQSRCFSFQDGIVDPSAKTVHVRFNLAIEMLFMSGYKHPTPDEGCVRLFQSRNRDAFHVRLCMGVQG